MKSKYCFYIFVYLLLLTCGANGGLVKGFLEKIHDGAHKIHDDIHKVFHPTEEPKHEPTIIVINMGNKNDHDGSFVFPTAPDSASVPTAAPTPSPVFGPTVPTPSPVNAPAIPTSSDVFTNAAPSAGSVPIVAPTPSTVYKDTKPDIDIRKNVTPDEDSGRLVFVSVPETVQGTTSTTTEKDGRESFTGGCTTGYQRTPDGRCKPTF
ncbi:growth-blocking peptide, long form-like [Melitaea cinxia]|uniref:growth-blocking peptide, long form-like n=1 Tax=Melitaea cinxia TaxID=113334 RepID=UPI001E27148E|nr:growth-blocking peptide, long form-like [Melitaea cinxia]